MQTHEELFVIGALTGAERDRARAENVLRRERGPGRPSAARAWLGRRFIAVGTFLAREPGIPPRSMQGRPG
jgi:hypothetical protein